jgi:hypothetical protein
MAVVELSSTGILPVLSNHGDTALRFHAQFLNSGSCLRLLRMLILVARDPEPYGSRLASFDILERIE